MKYKKIKEATRNKLNHQHRRPEL